ncbi:MAG: hypothetical protein EBX50_09750 [Chitinophagia bacterium]|nr:hypothetical protein [Chitinophagia bacterium]
MAAKYPLEVQRINDAHLKLQSSVARRTLNDQANIIWKLYDVWQSLYHEIKKRHHIQKIEKQYLKSISEKN